MKSAKIFLTICFAMLLLPASSQLAGGHDLFAVRCGGDLLTSSRQLTQLVQDGAGNWLQILPDGTTQTFTWGNGKYFVMTYVSVRWYAGITNTNPYRLFFRAPNGTSLCTVNLDNLYYPTTGSTVVGGGFPAEYFQPGIVMTVKPSVEVRNLPVPPNNPNSGTVIPGAMFIKIAGYVVP